MKVLNNKAIVVGLEKINLDDFPNLEVIGCNMTSCEHLPLEEMKRRGIKVISLKDYPEFLKSITSTAEHTIGLIIALLRKYKEVINTPTYLLGERDEYLGHTLFGKTLGIIGYGRVGKQVDAVAKALGMEVITFDRYEGLAHIFYVGSLEQVLAESDIVSIHIPLEGNEGFLTKEHLKRMKSTAYLINTSRNGVIEKGVLLDSLQNKIIAGAAIDFIDDPELMEYSKRNNNLILTSHLGGNTFEDRQRTENFIIERVNNHLNML